MYTHNTHAQKKKPIKLNTQNFNPFTIRRFHFALDNPHFFKSNGMCAMFNFTFQIKGIK